MKQIPEELEITQAPTQAAEPPWQHPGWGSVNSKTLKALFAKAKIEPFTKSEIESLRKLQGEFEETSRQLAAHSFEAIRAAIAAQKVSLRTDRESVQNLEEIEAPTHIESRMQAARKAIKFRKRSISRDAYAIVHAAMERARRPIAKFADALRDEEVKTFFDMGFEQHISSPILELAVFFEKLVQDFVAEGAFACAPRDLFHGLPGMYL